MADCLLQGFDGEGFAYISIHTRVEVELTVTLQRVGSERENWLMD